MDQNIKVTMTKQEAIKYYANKIVEDSLADCSEFNYCMSNEYYEDDGFVKENQEEILEIIKLDERVADVYIDKSSKPNTFDMVFWTDYCPHYWDEYDLSKQTQSKVLRKFIDQLINIKNNSIFLLNTSTQRVINDFLIANRFRFPLTEEEKDESSNMLKEFICNTNFFNKYLAKYKVVINKENIKELIVELQEKLQSLEIYKKDFIQILSKEDVDRMFEIFEKDKVFPDKYIGPCMYKDGNKYLAIDNSSCEMYIEEFNTEDECVNYLFHDENEEEEEQEE